MPNIFASVNRTVKRGEIPANVLCVDRHRVCMASSFSEICQIFLVREAGLEPARPKTQVPKTCVSAIPPLPLAVLG